MDLGGLVGAVIGGVYGVRDVYSYEQGPTPRIAVGTTPSQASAAGAWHF